MSQTGQSRPSHSATVLTFFCCCPKCCPKSDHSWLGFWKVAKGQTQTSRGFDSITRSAVASSVLRHDEVGLEIDQKSEFGPRAFRFMHPVADLAGG